MSPTPPVSFASAVGARSVVEDLATQPLRVLHVIDSAGLYGAELMLLNLASTLNERGHTCALVSIGTLENGPKAIEREAHRRGLPVRELRMRPGLNMLGASRLIALARTERADIIHSHGYKGNILLGLWPRSRRPAPVLTTLHGYTDTQGSARMRLYAWLDRRLLRRLDAVVLVHRGMIAGQRLASLWDGRWQIIENGIPRRLAPIPDLHHPIRRFVAGRPSIAVIARLSREKAQHVALAALQEIVRRGRDVRLVLFGDGPDRDFLEQRTRELAIADRVMFAGYVPDAAAFLTAFRMLVLPSLSEGLPLTVLEAMQAGVPVVASRVGGLPGVIEEGVTGVLVQPGSASALADACCQLLDDELFAAHMASAAREAVVRRFDGEAMALQYEQLYQQLLRVSKHTHARLHEPSKVLSR